MTRRATLGTAASLLVGTLAGCSAAERAIGVGGGPNSGANGRLTIDSSSMAPTLTPGQVIFVDGVVAGKYQPHRQDIVIVHPTDEYESMKPSALIARRVIGIPGDTVTCAGMGYPVKVNGAALSEPYLYKGDAPSTIGFEVKVPAGYLWLLGDHRSIALDCRYHLSDPGDGGIPVGNVVALYHPAR